ncbi:MAG: hypothetical protein LBN71_00450 [Tannerella sp.]|nr:hypothetical protein [Tannerella sp.]
MGSVISPSTGCIHPPKVWTARRAVRAVSAKPPYPSCMVGNDVLKQTVDGLHRGTLSRRDNTLLTVGFSLRTKQEQILKVPQGRHLKP